MSARIFIGGELRIRFSDGGEVSLGSVDVPLHSSDAIAEDGRVKVTLRADLQQLRDLVQSAFDDFEVDGESDD